MGSTAATTNFESPGTWLNFRDSPHPLPPRFPRLPGSLSVRRRADSHCTSHGRRRHLLGGVCTWYGVLLLPGHGQLFWQACVQLHDELQQLRRRSQRQVVQHRVFVCHDGQRLVNAGVLHKRLLGLVYLVLHGLRRGVHRRVREYVMIISNFKLAVLRTHPPPPPIYRHTHERH